MESGPYRVLRRQTNRLGSGLEARMPALNGGLDEAGRDRLTVRLAVRIVGIAARLAVT
jgi:hypothetical protein